MRRQTLKLATTCVQRLSTNALESSVPSQVATGDAHFHNNDILYTDDHMQMRGSVKKIIDKEINPFVEEWEANHGFPSHELFKKLGSAGLLGVNRKPEYGGLGLDYSYNMAVAEELGNIDCGGVPMAIGVQSDMATPALAAFGSEELKQEFLKPAVTGDVVVSIGVSEPGAGSDVASITTNAVRQGDDLVINGSKMWITNGMNADWICLLANTSKEGGPFRNKSLICVPMNEKGVTRFKIEKMGMHSSDTASLTFEDVRVPVKNIIGEEGMGFVYQMMQFQLERMFGIALTLVPLDRAIQRTIEYTRDRKAFGRPLLDNQVIHFTLAELSTEVEALRSLLYRMTIQYLRGNDVTYLASMGKLKAGRLAREVSDKCLQFWGGMGYADGLMSRMMRDMRLLSIGGGADEIMLSILCKYQGTLPKLPKN